MRRILYILALVLCSVSAVNAASVQTYRNNLGLFNSVKVLDNIRVVVKCNPDSTGYAVFSTTKQLASAPMFSISKGTLKVQVSTEYVNNPNLPTIYLYTDYVNYVANSSPNTVTVINPGAVPTFKAVLMGNGSIIADNIKATEVSASIISGNGTISLSGNAEKCSYTMMGTGVIQADCLSTDIASCKIVGSGSIGCNVAQKLDVRGIGSTKIYYKGNPKIKKVGGGKLIPLLDGDSSYAAADNEAADSDETDIKNGDAEITAPDMLPAEEEEQTEKQAEEEAEEEPTVVTLEEI